MPVIKDSYSPEEVEVMWRNPRFHAAGVEDRREAMSFMDPYFAEMDLTEQNKALERAYRLYGATPPQPIADHDQKRLGDLILQQKSQEEMARLTSVGPPVLSTPGTGITQRPGMFIPGLTAQEPTPGENQWLRSEQKLKSDAEIGRAAIPGLKLYGPGQQPLSEREQLAALWTNSAAAPPPGRGPEADFPLMPAALHEYPAQPPADPFTTKLAPQEEFAFQLWAKENGVRMEPGWNEDYDMRGLWKANPKAKADARGHWPDTWKKPNHETFSNESIYATEDAPKWDGAKLVAKDGRVIADESTPSGLPDSMWAPVTAKPPGAQSWDELSGTVVQAAARPYGTTANAAIRGLSEGTLGMAGGLGQLVGHETGLSGIKDLGKGISDINLLVKEVFPQPPEIRGKIADNPKLLTNPEWWLDLTANGIASMVPMLMTGGVTQAGIRGLVEAGHLTSKLGQQVVKWGPSVVAGVTEGTQAGASAYDEALREGKTPEEALRIFAIIAAGTSATSAVASKLGIFNEKIGHPAARGGVSALAEGGEEFTQGEVENYATGQPFGTNAAENILGGIVTGGAVGAGRGEWANRPEQNLERWAEREGKRWTMPDGTPYFGVGARPPEVTTPTGSPAEPPRQDTTRTPPLVTEPGIGPVVAPEEVAPSPLPPGVAEEPQSTGTMAGQPSGVPAARPPVARDKEADNARLQQLAATGSESDFMQEYLRQSQQFVQDADAPANIEAGRRMYQEMRAAAAAQPAGTMVGQEPQPQAQPPRPPAPVAARVTYMTGSAGDPRVAEAAKARGDLGLIFTPSNPAYLDKADDFATIGIDNGSFEKGGFRPDAFRRLVENAAAHPAADKVRFVVAPDVPMDFEATNAQFQEWADFIHSKGLPVAYAAQNGMENADPATIPWDDIDVLFVGGDTQWKTGQFDNAEQHARWRGLFAEAERRNIPVHVGRVNSKMRLDLSVYSHGATTVDGTHIAHHPTDNLLGIQQWLDTWNRETVEHPSDDTQDIGASQFLEQFEAYVDSVKETPHTANHDAVREMIREAQGWMRNAPMGLKDEIAKRLEQAIASAQTILRHHRQPAPPQTPVETGPTEGDIVRRKFEGSLAWTYGRIQRHQAGHLYVEQIDEQGSGTGRTHPLSAEWGNFEQETPAPAPAPPQAPVEEPPAAPKQKSWKYQIRAHGESGFSDNQVRFASKEEAEKAASELMGRWFGADESRVVESEDEPNYYFDDEQYKPRPLSERPAPPEASAPPETEQVKIVSEQEWSEIEQRLRRKGPKEPLSDDYANLIDDLYRTISRGESLGNNTQFLARAQRLLNRSAATGLPMNDLYDLLEAAVAMEIAANGQEYAKGIGGFNDLKLTLSTLPTQTTRDEDKQAFQQFSTPPTLGLLAAKALGIVRGELLMEPSAGTAQLAAWGRSFEARVIANELHQRRAQILQYLGYPVTMYDGEHLGAHWGHDFIDIRPSAILMNPPFSSAGHKGITGTQIGMHHIQQALRILAEGGRIVAILGEGQMPGRNKLMVEWQKVMLKGNVRAAILLPGKEYNKYGTTFSNAMVVIDKTGPTPGNTLSEKLANIKQVQVESYADALRTVEEIGNSRSGAPLELPPAGTSPSRGGRPGRRGVSGPGDVQRGPEPNTPPGVPPQQPEPRVEKPDTGQAGGGVGAGAGDVRRPGERPGGSERPGGPVRPPSGQGPGPVASQPSAAPKPVHSTDPKVILAKALADKADAAKAKLGGLLKPKPLPPGSTPAIKGEQYEVDAQTIADNFAEFAQLGAQMRNELGHPKIGPWKTEMRYTFGPAIEPFLDDLNDATIEAYESERIAAEETARQNRERPPEPDEEPPPPPVPEIAPAPVEDVGEDNKFSRYVPAKLPPEWGGQPHKGKVIETAAMAGTEPPPITTKPNVPQELIDSGELSEIQIEVIAYAIQSHERRLTDGRRQGFFIGDGTGIGKGREIAGLIIHYWNEGIRRQAWVSDNERLMNDASRDLTDLGHHTPAKQMTPKQLTKLTTEVRAELSRLGYDHIPLLLHGDVGRNDVELPWKEGIVFSPYTTLRAPPTLTNEQKRQLQQAKETGGKKAAQQARAAMQDTGGYPRLEQLMHWLNDGPPDENGIYHGEPFIAFDEAHKAKNAVVKKGKRGKSKPTRTANVVLDIDRRVPNARILYASATGASEVSNLGYLGRLGIWGPGTAWDGFTSFQADISSGGIQAMEVVARALKEKGQYAARFLSFEDCEFDELTHEATDQDKEIWDESARAWRMVLGEFEHALDETKAHEDQAGQTVSQFWAAALRFQRQLFSSMKLPTLFRDIRNELANDRCAIVSFLYTGQAAQDRALSKAAEEETGLEDLDLSPFQILQKLIVDLYPVIEYEETIDPTDPEGRRTIRTPIRDEDGNFKTNPEMEAARDALLQRLEQLKRKLPQAPLHSLVTEFGEDDVAEMSGRDERLVTDPETGEVRLEKRKFEGISSGMTSVEEARLFNAGQKLIGIISPQSSTGISLHASNKFVNQRRRVHYMFQLKWEASEQSQELGRANRTNQASGPIFRLVSIDIGGDKRFASSIARRLSQMGALTRGQSGSVGAGAIEKYNYESAEGDLAAFDLGVGLFVDRFPEIRNGVQLLENMGLIDTSAKGALTNQMPRLTVRQLLNRIMALEVDDQNRVFAKFHEILKRKVEAAEHFGLADKSVNIIKGDTVELDGDPQVVWTDPVLGSKTTYSKIKVKQRLHRIDWDSAKTMVSQTGSAPVPGHPGATQRGGEYQFVRRKRDNVLFVAHRQVQTGANKKEYYGLRTPSGAWLTEDAEAFVKDFHQNVLPSEQDGVQWMKRHDAKEFSITYRHLFSGGTLDNWNRFKTDNKKPLKFAMTTTDKGQRIVGVDVPGTQVKTVLRAFNVATAAQNPAEIYSRVIEDGQNVRLTGGMTLRRTSIKGEPRIEILDVPPQQQNEVKRLGAIHEAPNRYDWRYFIPVVGTNADVQGQPFESDLGPLTRILERFPAIEEERRPGREEEAAEPSEAQSAELREPGGAQSGHPARKARPRRPDGTEISENAILSNIDLGRLSGEDADQGRVSRQEIVDKISAEMNSVPIRVGKYRVPGALGIFKIKAEVVRSKDALDIPVITHEIGHYINKKLWGFNDAARELNTSPIAQFAHELDPMASQPRPGKSETPEGFAEFMRHYLTKPDLAKQHAPGFYNHLENVILAADPKLRTALFNIRAMIRQWQRQGPEHRVGASISMAPKPKGIGAKAKAAWQERQQLFARFYTAQVDQLHPLKRTVEALRALVSQHGAGVPASRLRTMQRRKGDDAYTLARLLAGWWGKADHFLVHKTFHAGTGEITGKGLREILEPVDKYLQDDSDETGGGPEGKLRRYMVALRVLEKTGKWGLQTGISVIDAQAIVDEYDQKYPELKVATEELDTYQDALLRYMVDSGMMSEAGYENIKELNRSYFPFYRVTDFHEMRYNKGIPALWNQVKPGAASRRMVNVGDPVKRFRGSSYEIIDPLESIVKNTFMMISAADRNRVGLALTRQARQTEGSGGLVERIPGPLTATKLQISEIEGALTRAGVNVQDPNIDWTTVATIFRPGRQVKGKEFEITVMNKGRREYYQLQPDLYNTLHVLDEEAVNIYFRLAGAVAGVLRAGATVYSIDFALIRNPERDAWTAFAQSQHGFIPIWHSFVGLKHKLKEDETYWEWMRSGGAHAAKLSMDRVSVKRKLDKVVSKGGFRDKVRHPLEAMQMLSEATEAMTRLGEYHLARKAGENPALSALASRDVSIDFARIGSMNRALNLIAAFYNAGIQGVDRFIAVHRRDPKGAALRGSLFTVASIIIYLLNRDDEDYHSMPAWQKDLFWNIPIPKSLRPHLADIRHIPIIKPPLWGWAYGTIAERALEAWDTGEYKEQFDRLAASLRQQTPGIPTPTGLQVPVELWANKSGFTGLPIDPPQTRHPLSPHYRVKGNTTEFARHMAKLLHDMGIMEISPTKIDHAIGGFAGGGGRNVVGLLDLFIPSHYDRPSSDLSEWPIARSLIRQGTPWQTSEMTKLYDRLEKLNQKANDVKNRDEYPRGAAAGAPDLTYEEEEELERLSGAAKEIGGITQEMREVEHGELSRNEKRQQINELLKQRANIARQAVYVSGRHPAIRRAN